MANDKKRIGLLIHNIHDSYSIQITEGLKKYCRENNYHLTTFPVSAMNAGKFGFEYRHNPLLQLVTKNNVDGLVVSTGSITSFMTLTEIEDFFAKFKDLPVVSLGIDVPSVPIIQVKTEEPFKEMVRHLITVHKRKKFLLLKSNSETFDSNIRTKWFMDVLDEFNIDIDKSHIVNGEFNETFSYQVMKEYIENNGINFDCAVCLNDEMAFGLIQILEENNIEVPKQVIVTGYDNGPLGRFSSPALTTIDPQITLQGYKAGVVLSQLFNKEKVAHNTIIHGKEKFRCSCGCVKLNDYKIESINSKGKVYNYSEKEILNFIHQNPKSANAQFHILHYMMSYTLTSFSQREFRSKLPKFLEKTAIPAFAICVYDEPIIFTPTDTFEMPDKVKCIFSYERGIKSNLTNKGISFNPKKNLLSSKIFKKDYPSLALFSVFENSYQYGFFITTLTTEDYMFYEVLFETISKQITSEIDLSAEQELSKELVKKTTNLEKYNSLLNDLSNTDELTKINNRRGFMYYSKKLISESLEAKKTGMIIYGDMDGLKKINDTWGHESGDRAIKACAEILSRISRTTDVIGRLSGDEFAVAAKGMTPETFRLFKKRVEEECDKYNNTSNEPFRVSISLGCTQFTKEKSDLAKLLSLADKDLYKEKVSKKNSKLR